MAKAPAKKVASGKTLVGKRPKGQRMPAGKTYRFTASLWLYPGMTGNWHFITVPKEVTEDIADRYAEKKRGWGSLRVSTTIGKSTWESSIFPDKKSGCFVLPVKAAVRKAEDLYAKQPTNVALRVLT